MKKQLEKEIEQHAPYPQGLEQRILQKTYKSKTWKYPFVLASFVVLCLCASILFLKEQPLRTSIEDEADIHVEAAVIPSDDGQVYLNSVMKVTQNGKQTIMEIQMIEDYYLEDGTYKETKLTSGYKEMTGEVVIDNVQKIIMTKQPSTVVVAEEMAGKVVENGEELVKKQIAATFGKTDERKDLRHLEFFTVNKNEPVTAPEDILALQQIFGQIQWYEDVEKKMTENPDARLTLFIRYDINQPERLLEYHIWLEDAKITLIGEDGYGELTGEQATLLTHYLQADAGVQSVYHTIIVPEDIQTAKELIEKAVRQPGIANMADPETHFELEGKRYFLWWGEDDSATFMHADDTYTVYRMSSAGEMQDILDRAR